MKPKAKKYLLLASALLLGLAALPVSADLVPCKDDCRLEQLVDVIALVINYLFSIAGLIAVLLVLWGGLQMILSSGNPAQVQAAKSTVWNALLGLVLVLAAYMIVIFVIGVLTGNPGFNPYEQAKSFLRSLGGGQ